MTNRGLIGSFAGTYVARFSRPGYNVLDDTIAPAGVGFDSRRTSAFKLWMAGYIAWSGSPASVTVGFGTTFGFVPTVIYAPRNGLQLGWIDSPIQSIGGPNQQSIGDVTTSSFFMSREGFPYSSVGIDYMVLVP